MNLRFVSVFIVFWIIVLSFPLASSAEAALHAPGGTVKSDEDLIVALGGSDVVIDKETHLLLRSDIILDAPITIVEGKYTLVGAGCQISAAYDDAPLLILAGENSTSLSLGAPASSSANDSFILNGNKSARTGPLIAVEENSELSIYGGTVFIDALSSVNGGAITNEGTVTMYGGRIENCRSLSSGGAIFNKGELYLVSGKILTSTAEQGGAIYNDGKAKLTGTEFVECLADRGGCVYNTGSLEFVSSTVSTCIAGQGGALYNDSEATLCGGQILACVSENGEGGGVYNIGTLTCRGTYFENNTAKFGGNIYNASSLLISEGQIYGGNATYGGNVYVAPEAEMTLSGGVISGGKASVGGGVFNKGTLRLTGGSIYCNKATSGPGVMNQGSFIISERGHVDFDNAVFIPITDNNEHAILIEGDPIATKIASLIPVKITDTGYEVFYEPGVTLVVGSNLSEHIDCFMIGGEQSDKYLLAADGTLRRPVPFYKQTRFYFSLLGIFMVTVTLIVLCVRFMDRKREKRS